MKHFYLLSLAFLFSCLTSCQSVPKLLETNQPEKAYALALRQSTRGRALREKQYVNYLAAYEAIQRENLGKALALKQTGGTAKFAELYELYSDLYDRSLELLRIAPGAADRLATNALAPAELEREREQARKLAGAHFLSRIDSLRVPALAGDKPAARKVHDFYERVDYYLPERSAEFDDEISVMKDIGTLRIEVYVPPGEGDNELLRGLSSQNPVERNWTTILPFPTNLRIDLEAEILYDRYQESGPSESCDIREYSEEVLERIEKKEVKEKVNDSTWVKKIIEIKHYKTVYAEVRECTQSAMVCAYGYVIVYPRDGEVPVWKADITGVERWSNTYSVGFGDRRALPAFANSGCYRSPPSLGGMLRRATRDLPGSAMGELKREYASKEKGGTFWERLF